MAKTAGQTPDSSTGESPDSSEGSTHIPETFLTARDVEKDWGNTPQPSKPSGTGSSVLGHHAFREQVVTPSPFAGARAAMLRRRSNFVACPRGCPFAIGKHHILDWRATMNNHLRNRHGVRA